VTYPIDKYKAQAKGTFRKLTNEIATRKLTTPKTWTNVWQIGNVFDTLTDYLVRFPDSEKGTPKEGTVAQIAWDCWTDEMKSPSPSLCWYDDFGWWGIASEKAFRSEYGQIFGSHRRDFQTIARTCFEVMKNGKLGKAYNYRGGPNVWNNRENGKPTAYFTSPDTWAVPRFEGGVWQYELFKNKRPKKRECSISNPSDPNLVNLGPFQNTVMNGLYLVLALRLRQPGRQGKETAEAIKYEHAFLKSWFELDQDQGLLRRFSDTTVLVRERVGTYAFCPERGIHPPVRGYDPEGHWCGDQGLILGGLLDYLAVESSDPTAQSLAISIASGVVKHMVEDHVVQPYSSGFNDQGDPEDYECGSGVFWRYLLRGFRQNAALRNEVLSWVAADPENNAIYRSAEDACTPPGKSETHFRKFNILATLIAAIEILGKATRRQTKAAKGQRDT
jgi:hypothetical protein